ncbi:uncharacterized protein MONBRDRAFT_24292 [Monosiga brevicollis MX1]|uniref:LIM zinc-binding domain-containing protein n=1 Tax=Monosiga brevicollis TaxID=81824 RepID=A9UVZ4_MONBE|nr:uncharacterized protein MONBRDRAFT_24292 [Monosiga brevicollis MX1]EDQ90474.1 predicted protein [Monosiga brevicollis MX1]|eukprot:XP_001744525.1 hypothetical protein [Monosiga brevicollis MX1]
MWATGLWGLCGRSRLHGAGVGPAGWMTAWRFLRAGQRAASPILEFDILTSDARAAGCECNALVKVEGSRNSFEGRLHPKSGLFERGQREIFRERCDDLGRIRALVIGPDRPGKDDGWLLNSVILRILDDDNRLRRVFTFECNRWLGGRHEASNPTLSVTLTPQQSVTPDEVRLKTQEKPLSLIVHSVAYPHPDKVQQGRKGLVGRMQGYAGEDAYAISHETGPLHGLFLADGVHAWHSEGIDAGAWARELTLGLAHQHDSAASAYAKAPLAERVRPGLTLVEMVEHVYQQLLTDGVQGSSTLVSACFDGSTGALDVYNLGDSGLSVLRRRGTIGGADVYGVLYRTPVLEHRFGCPYQLGHHAQGDTPEAGLVKTLALQPDDIVVMGSDGLWDNLLPSDMARICSEPSSRRTLHHRLAAAAFNVSLDRNADSPFAREATEELNMFYSGAWHGVVEGSCPLSCRARRGFNMPWLPRQETKARAVAIHLPIYPPPCWQPPKAAGCQVCSKPVYYMEKLEADEKVYHKTCFKCSVCKKSLSAGTYAAMSGVLYCKPHFKQMFKAKGNYNFGAHASDKPSSYTVTTKASSVPARPASSEKAVSAPKAAPALAERMKAFHGQPPVNSVVGGNTTPAPPTVSDKALRESESMAKRGGVAAIAARFLTTQTEGTAPQAREAASRRRSSTAKVAEVARAFAVTAAVPSPAQEPQGSKPEAPVRATPRASGVSASGAVKCDVVPPKTAVTANQSVRGIRALFEKISATSTTPAPVTICRPKYVFNGSLVGQGADAQAVQAERPGESVQEAKVTTVDEHVASPISTGASDLDAQVAKPEDVKPRSRTVSSVEAEDDDNSSADEEDDEVSDEPEQGVTATHGALTDAPILQREASTLSTVSLEFEATSPTLSSSAEMPELKEAVESSEEAQAQPVLKDTLNESEESDEDEDALIDEDPLAEYEPCDGVHDSEENENANEASAAEEDAESSDKAPAVHEHRLSRRLSSLLNVADAFDVDLENLSIVDQSIQDPESDTTKENSNRGSFISLDKERVQPVLPPGKIPPLGRRLSSMMNLTNFLETDFTHLEALEVAN